MLNKYCFIFTLLLTMFLLCIRCNVELSVHCCCSCQCTSAPNYLETAQVIIDYASIMSRPLCEPASLNTRKVKWTGNACLWAIKSVVVIQSSFMQNDPVRRKRCWGQTPIYTIIKTITQAPHRTVTVATHTLIISKVLMCSGIKKVIDWQ